MKYTISIQVTKGGELAATFNHFFGSSYLREIEVHVPSKAHLEKIVLDGVTEKLREEFANEQ